jgi:hypothetical protein
MARSGARANEPLLKGQALLWATPTSHERTHSSRAVDHGEQLANHASAYGEAMEAERNRKHGLLPLVMKTDGARGSRTAVLSPSFVETLMGLPLSWTVPTVFERLATPLYQLRPELLSSNSRGGR